MDLQEIVLQFIDEIKAFKEELMQRMDKLEKKQKELKEDLQVDLDSLSSSVRRARSMEFCPRPESSRIRYFYNGQSEANSITDPDISDY